MTARDGGYYVDGGGGEEEIKINLTGWSDKWTRYIIYIYSFEFFSLIVIIIILPVRRILYRIYYCYNRQQLYIRIGTKVPIIVYKKNIYI